MMLGWMGSLGLPLLAGFVAEIAILIAFWMSFGWLVLLPALTLIITAVYYINSMQKTIFESNDRHHGILPESLHGEEPSDVTWHENTSMFILGILSVLFGILPFIFFDMMSDWSTEFIQEVLLESIINEGVKP
jgi:NADH-quinone oxidoreductase subunit M